MKKYSCTAVSNLIGEYMEKGGIAYTLEEGSLGYGLTVCIAEGYKTAVIREQFLNCWESIHTVRMYNRIPQKYADMITERFPNDIALVG